MVQVMAAIYLNSNVCIDIYETDGLYAEIVLFNAKSKIGPAYDMADLNRTVFDFIQEFISTIKMSESQKLQVNVLQDSLANCQLDESDYFESF